MQWIVQNKEWFFSGVGATILALIVGFFLNSKGGMSQKSGKNSNNYQAGKNINIGGKHDK
ncbi:hypothetical protein [Pseudacidovorax intermedius]|uniref:hypothetical protein n=1 Tax=Pseudacidovorax intermedius TaxID=433924 RepID=UPI0009DBFB3B|nr:hypothetical protein [Pseudacidovorax intermedius]